MADAKPAVCVHPGRRAAWYGDDVQRGRAVAILNAMLGSYGRPGGRLIRRRQRRSQSFRLRIIRRPAEKSVDGAASTYPFASKKLMWSLIHATAEQRPYPIKAWVVSGCNPMQSIPTRQSRKRQSPISTSSWSSTFCRAKWPDGLIWCCRSAHISSAYDDLHAPNFRDPYVALRQPVIPPMYESRPEL